MMRSLQVALGARSYPIHLGRDLDPALLADALAGRPAVALVDAQVAAVQGPRLDALLGGRPRLTVPSGEGTKTLAQLERLARELIALGLGRDGALVAVGGGVCGDLGGFLAASYLRGIPFVQVPTTVLAQVDASVGGKVAVNLPGAKNSLGAFHQPLAVLADLGFLDTLPRRERAAGLAELAKMAATLDADLLAALEQAGESLLDPRSPALPDALLRGCALKAAVVAEDEREAGRRAILNFGHTLAHALEGATLAGTPVAAGEAPLLHGEAVAIGMLFALRLGAALGVTAAEGAEPRLARLLARWSLPLRPAAGADAQALVRLMGSDKKRRGGALRFVLLEDWGRSRHGVEVAPESVERALVDFLLAAPDTEMR
ncbi:3-dehydroquinate synthase [bacterium]|nr:3-dehydroquinate synthase [bacterium]